MDHARTLADHDGQLKVLPGIAAAVQQNFGIWFAVIGLVAAVITFGFAFLGSYQVWNNQQLSQHGQQLAAQGAALERVEGDVSDVKDTLDDVNRNVALIAQQSGRAADQPRQR